MNVYRGGNNSVGMREHLERVVGNGEKVYFWWDNWVGGCSLKDRFPRLFNCSRLKNAKVAEMGKWVGEEWKWDWKWRRNFSSNNINAFNELVDMVDRIKISKQGKDGWRWNLAPNGNYSTKIAYDRLAELDINAREMESEKKVYGRLWKCWAPRRMTVIAWKILKQRIATRDNLNRRGLLSMEDDVSCPFCKQAPESSMHILFECSSSAALWSEILSWMEVAGAFHNHPYINFLHFGELWGKEKKNIKMMATIWVGIVCRIWQARNDLIFNNLEPDFQKVAVELKLNIKSWCAIHLPKVKECNVVEWLGDIRKSFVAD